MKIIAELATNWDNITDAMNGIEEANRIGCYAVKFQLFNNENIKNSIHYDKLKNKILSKFDAEVLFNLGKKRGIHVFFTCFYIEAIEWCEAFGVSFYKIREADNRKRELYIKIKRTKKPIFVSCRNVRDSLYYNLSLYNNNDVRFLFCIPEYPASELDYYHYYINQFQGISDHTSGVNIIKKYWDKVEYLEKHIKLHEEGIEDKWAITFDQLKDVMKECQ